MSAKVNLLGKIMYESQETDDYYDECWADEASKDEMKKVIPVHVMTPTDVKEFARICYYAGWNASRGWIDCNPIPEEFHEFIIKLFKKEPPRDG